MATEIKWDDFSEPKPNRDVALVVEDRYFWIPKDSLADISSYFSSLFYSDLTKPTNDEIILSDKKADEILELLRCLFYTAGVKKSIDYDNVVTLSKLADEYGIKCLELDCKKFFDSMIEGNNGLLAVFTAAINSKQTRIVRAVLPMVARLNLTDLNPMLVKLPDPAHNAVLYQKLSQNRVVNGKFNNWCDACDSLITVTNNMPSDYRYCRCINEMAMTELEKMDEKGRRFCYLS